MSVFRIIVPDAKRIRTFFEHCRQGIQKLLLASGRGRAFWLAAMAFCFAGQAKAAPPSPAEAQASQIWDRLLTHCGDSFFYAGSIFDKSGMMPEAATINHPFVIEFRGVETHTVAIQVTDAEHLNGISARARVTLIADVYRMDGSNWVDGPARQPRNMNDILGEAFQDITADIGEMGIGGTMAFDLVQSKGTWLVSRSSSDISGALLSSQGYYRLDQLQGSAAPKYSEVVPENRTRC